MASGQQQQSSGKNRKKRDTEEEEEEEEEAAAAAAVAGNKAKLPSHGYTESRLNDDNRKEQQKPELGNKKNQKIKASKVVAVKSTRARIERLGVTGSSKFSCQVRNWWAARFPTCDAELLAGVGG
ncbi:hypothetical protein CCMA1212_010235 [Trichoderma ghanense]|uniref:Uncharacterized protein n=1 Tax=Trichoderma ghanense TaxID=65468 RepID=A0ABY2GSV6_9HYPO